MNQQLIQNLNYSYIGQYDVHSLPYPLIESLQLISNFFATNSTNKLCLVFPSKEYVAQWLSIPLVLFQIESDFKEFNSEIYDAGRYNRGDKLLLNKKAIVEWLAHTADVISFRHSPYKGTEVTGIHIKNISKLDLAPASRQSLSSYNSVKKALYSPSSCAIDQLLNIGSEGNTHYQKKSVCLVSKYKSFSESIEYVLINRNSVSKYFRIGKIDENGTYDLHGPLLHTNSLSNLALLTLTPAITSTISTIIIDGIAVIQERGTDFNDVDERKIPTILITDLSEIDGFEFVSNYGFEFFNFTKENLKNINQSDNSPFQAFNNKLVKYLNFSVVKEVCENQNLEIIIKLIHSIKNDGSVKELMSLKILLIQLTNLVSRITHTLSQNEAAGFRDKLNKMEQLFITNRFYLGDSNKVIEEAISLFKIVIEKFSVSPSEKCVRLGELIRLNNYDYIICITEDEALSLSLHLNPTLVNHKPNVISVANVNNILVEDKPVKAILIGWAKINNMNRLLSSFLFSELTILYYQFECRYFNSLQIRNKRFSSKVKSTITKQGVRREVEITSCFEELYGSDTLTEQDSKFDIAAFELNLDNALYSKYIVKGNLGESVKAKRVEFKNDKFIYLTDTHSLLVLENFFQRSGRQLSIHKSRIENLRHGDVIAFLKTERELLSKVVARQATPSALAETTKWIELWKQLLRKHYNFLHNDFIFLRSLNQSHLTATPRTFQNNKRIFIFFSLRHFL